MTPLVIGIGGIIVFVILIFLSMNIGLAMMIVGVAGYALIVTPTAAFAQLRTDPATTASTYALMVIPLFILMGNYAFQAGLSAGLFDTANKWLNRLPAPLACATIAASAGFGSICGSLPATTATMCTIALPEMRRHGYNDRLSTGSIAIGGTLGPLIPPSTPLVIFAIMAEASIGKLFIAAIIPGLMVAGLAITMVVILITASPGLAPKGSSFSWKERLVSLKNLIGVVVLFGLVLGGMFTGFFSVNQAAAVGAFAALIIMIVNMWLQKDLTWKKFKVKFNEATWTSIRTFAMTFLLVIGASVFGKFLTISGLTMAFSDYLLSLNVSRYLIIALMLGIYLFLGMIMDDLPMIMITVPLFLPIIQGLGFDTTWFGIFILLIMAIGAITPPVALNCFIIYGIGKDIPLVTIYKGIIPFVLVLLVSVVLITAFPQIALFLPGLMMT
ncbi:MAG: TRAP transporter large permease [Clostridiales bacterium]|nr:TRAP transporter large permease [Clostridiales bacterium]